MNRRFLLKMYILVMLIMAVAIFGVFFIFSPKEAEPLPVPELVTFYFDADGDGYGQPDVSVQREQVPHGYASNNLDCDDSRPEVYPGAREICGNQVDDNCDGRVDYVFGFQIDEESMGYLYCSDVSQLKNWPADQPCIDVSVVFPGEFEPRMWRHCRAQPGLSSADQGRDPQ